MPKYAVLIQRNSYSSAWVEIEAPDRDTAGNIAQTIIDDSMRLSK
jgi:hypothetical protein